MLMRFAVILLVGTMLLSARPDDDLKTIKLNGVDCGPEGSATSKAGKALDRLKNRYLAPGADDIDPEVSLSALLAPGYDVNRFDSTKAATIRGYVVDVMVGGKETCNCEATAPDERDTHIELALSPHPPEIQRMIVEITPRGRKIKGEAWTTPAVKKTFKGKWVEVTGWLLFDTMHINQAANTNPGNPGNWRATCWEIHPVTDIKVITPIPTAVTAFQPTSFAALQQLHADHVTGSARALALIRDRNKKKLADFDPKELEEAENEAKERPADKK
jgi:hypothetical protein